MMGVALARPLYRWLAGLSVLAFGACIMLVLAYTRRPQHWPEPVRAANAVGDATCLACHRDKATFERTAHRLTMRSPTRESIAGSFRKGQNVLRTADPDIHFRMDSTPAGFYETLVVGKAPDSTSRTERIAYVAGSGRKGQSFLYWSGDELFQLPVSYWTSLHRWIGSPGRAGIDPRASFQRAVAPRCMECHDSWIEAVPDPTLVNHFRPGGAILGITCERCHGSGQEHVTNERSALHAIRRPVIVNPARLTRERQMEVCSQCHGGLGEPIMPAFSYVAGRRLENYLHLIPRSVDETVDVHANQVALLSRSRCYSASQMTCLTCHDVHRPQRDVVELSGRCLTCHQEQSCGLYPKLGHALAGRCVDCHMRLETSKLVVSDLEGEKKRVQGRSHWIRVYPETAPR
jgi:hypothetical protein